MIVKEADNPKKSSSKSGRVRGLAKYICNPETVNFSEKCTYSNAIGFISDTKNGQQAEMLSLSLEAVRSKDTIKHYIFSWKEGEYPSHKQIDEIVSILLRETGLEGHQSIYGLHQDTDNIHLHIMLNRVHPDTLKLVEINQGFDIEPLHRVVAIIEHKQGWSREKNGRYFVLENGDICRSYIDVEASPEPGQNHRDREHRTGEKSAQRIAIEVAIPVLKNANSWRELHEDLSRHGISYQRVAKGAVVAVSDIKFKSSALGASVSFSRLQERLGNFEPSVSSPHQSAKRMQPLSTDVPGWVQYEMHMQKYRESIKNKNDLKQVHADEMQALRNRQQDQRSSIFSRDWAGKGTALNAFRAVLAEGHAMEIKEMQSRHREELNRLSIPFPEWPEWKQSRLKSPPDLQSKKMGQSAPQSNTSALSERLKLLEKYHNALRADAYRVTSVRKFPDGSQVILMLGGRQDGIKGFTHQELVENEHVVQNMQKKGDALKYTPISEDKHYILVDQLSQESLDKLLRDGYMPSVVLESEPGRFQAIVTIPKLEMPFDDQVGHVLTLFFNKKYGDPERQCIGAMHPHVAPGSIVRLPENSNNVADTHVATLIKAEYCECTKTQSLAAVILEELQPKSELKQQESQQDELMPVEKSVVDAGTQSGIIKFKLENLEAVSLQVEPTPPTPKKSGPGMS